LAVKGGFYFNVYGEQKKGDIDFNPDPLSYHLDFVTSTSMKISWETRSDIVVYFLDRDAIDNFPYYKGPDNTVTISNLKPNTEYKFILAGQKDPNNRTFPTRFTVRTKARAVSPPAYFTAYDQIANEVSFFWSPGHVEFGEPRYEIRRDGDLLETPAQPPFTDTGPQQGRTHVYCIRTFDGEFNFSEPVCVEVKFKDVTPPTAPSSVRTSNLGLTLSWDESYDSSGDINYIVDQGLGNELGRTRELEFAVTGLELGRRYEFGVTATDNAGHLSDRVIVLYPALGVSVKGKP
jgi:chitin-binding protein